MAARGLRLTTASSSTSFLSARGDAVVADASMALAASDGSAGDHATALATGAALEADAPPPTSGTGATKDTLFAAGWAGAGENWTLGRIWRGVATGAVFASLNEATS